MIKLARFFTFFLNLTGHGLEVLNQWGILRFWGQENWEHRPAVQTVRIYAYYLVCTVWVWQSWRGEQYSDIWWKGCMEQKKKRLKVTDCPKRKNNLNDNMWAHPSRGHVVCLCCRVDYLINGLHGKIERHKLTDRSKPSLISKQDGCIISNGEMNKTFKKKKKVRS